MTNTLFRKLALMAVTLTILSACSSECHCPTCPVQSQPTTIIHEPRDY